MMIATPKVMGVPGCADLARRGEDVLDHLGARQGAPPMLPRLRQATDSVLDHDHPAIHDQAEVNRAERKQVGGDAEVLHPDHGEQHGERNGAGDDQRAAHVAEQQEQHGDDQDAAFQQVALNRTDGLFNQFGAVIDGRESHVGGQGSAHLAHLLVHGKRHGAGVRAFEHHRDAQDGFFAVVRGRALAQSAALGDGGDIPQEDRGAVFGGNNDALDIALVADDPDTPHQQALCSLDDVAAARVRVVALDRFNDFTQGHTPRQQPLRVDLYLVLLLEPALAVYLSDSWHGAKLRLDQEVLERTQFGRAALLGVQGVLVNLAQPRRNRGHFGRADTFGQAFPRSRELLAHELAREVQVHIVGEDDRHLGQPVLRKGAHLGYIGQPSQCYFDGKGNQLFHFGRREARNRRVDLDLIIGHVRQGVDGQALESDQPPEHKEDRPDQDEKALPHAKFKDAFDHFSARGPPKARPSGLRTGGRTPPRPRHARPP